MAYEVVVQDPLGCCLEAQKGVFLRKFCRITPLLLAVTALLVIPPLVFSCTRPLAYAASTLAAVLLLFPFLAYMNAIKLMKKAFRSVPSGAYTFTFDEEAASWRTTVSESRVSWNGFTALYMFKNVWALIIAERQFIALPVAQMEEGLKVLIMEKIRKAE